MKVVSSAASLFIYGKEVKKLKIDLLWWFHMDSSRGYGRKVLEISVWYSAVPHKKSKYRNWGNSTVLDKRSCSLTWGNDQFKQKREQWWMENPFLQGGIWAPGPESLTQQEWLESQISNSVCMTYSYGWS